MANEVAEFGRTDVSSITQMPLRNRLAELRIIRLKRYLSRRDFEWLRTQDPAAARRRWRWCYGQFVLFCRELQREQRRISRERSVQQCAPVGELIRLEAVVNLQIAALFGLGTLYFAGVPAADAGRIVQRYVGVDQLMHQGLATANVPA